MDGKAGLRNLGPLQTTCGFLRFHILASFFTAYLGSKMMPKTQEKQKHKNLIFFTTKKSNEKKDTKT